MLKEIDEQPAVMRKLIATYANEDGTMKVDQDIIKGIQEADRIYIIAAERLIMQVLGQKIDA